MTSVSLSDREFAQFQRFILDAAGITLSAAKKALVSGRLAKRLTQRALASYGEYLALLHSGRDAAEVQLAIDLLTTNETYFYREPQHFELLARLARAYAGVQPLRAWSAACSSGEEPYTMAMVLADTLGSAARWEVLGTDISQRVLERARRGHYPIERARSLPPELLRRHCLRGIAEQEGTLLVERSLRQCVQFVHANLNAALPHIGSFDVVFLRNVMIYFDAATKRGVVARVLQQLRPGGHLVIGHSETLHGLADGVEMVAPSVYRRTGEPPCRTGLRASSAS